MKQQQHKANKQTANTEHATGCTLTILQLTIKILQAKAKTINDKPCTTMDNIIHGTTDTDIQDQYNV